MKLTGAQIEELHQAMLAAFDQSTLEMMLRIKLEKRLDIITGSGPLKTVVFDLIGVAEREGWIYKLIHEAQAWNPGNERLATFVESLPAQLLDPSDAPPEPVQTCFLYGAKDLAFVNRGEFRKALQSLESGGIKIVVVDGPECSGKTYSLNLVSYLADTMVDTERRFKPVYVDLTSLPTAERGAEGLLKHIAAQMSIALEPGAIPAQNASDPRWATQLGSWLLGKVRDSEKVWWIVLDGLLQADIPDETRHFIGNLAQNALIEPALHLVLLSYRKDLLPPLARPRAREEKIVPLQRLDLKAFFEQVLKEQDIAFDSDAVDPVVEYVVGKVAPPYTAERLNALPEVVKEATEILLS